MLRDVGRRWMVGLVLVAALGAGCGSDDDEESASEGAAFDSADESATTIQSGGGGSAAVESGGEGIPSIEIRTASQVQDSGRAILRTAALEVRAADVEEASVRAIAAAEGAGGFLASQNSDLEGTSTSSLTFRVPPDAFSRVLADLADLGELIRREVGTDDVTEEFVDLEGRVSAAEASVDRLRGLLSEAGSVPDVVAIESELSRREGELEALTGQLRSLSDQVDLATVSLLLTEERRAREPEPAEGLPGFFDGLRRGAVLFVDAGRVVLLTVGFALPFLGLAALLWFPARLLIRSVRRRLPAPTA